MQINKERCFKEVTLKNRYFETKQGLLTAKELYERNLPYDLYLSHDEIMGVSLCWTFPKFSTSDFSGLCFALVNIANYQQLIDKYQELINQDPMVKCFLIPFLIMGETIKPRFKEFKTLPIWTTPSLLSNKDLFLSLVKQGAQYKNFLSYYYKVVSPQYLQRFLSLFGSEVTRFPADESSYIALLLTSHYDSLAFEKISQLLDYGADINERIDRKYKNTILLYLIALECQERAIQLIDFVENLPQPFVDKNPNCKIDYSLQDKLGKTALSFSVSLELTNLVKKILQLTQKQKNIGLNISDHQGRTAAMIAAALGHKDLLAELIRNGANLFARDSKSRDITWYMHAPEEEVRSILKELSIHTERSFNVNHSYLYSATPDSTPLVLEDDAGNQQPLLLSSKEPHLSLLMSVLQYATEHPNHDFIKLDHIYDQLDPMMKAKENNTDCSILESKLKRQVTTRVLVKQTLFFMACAFGDLKTVKNYLENEGVNINAYDHLKRNALHYTVMRDELVLKLLESQQLSISVKDCLENHFEVFTYLITKKGDFNHKNCKENSPLELLIRDSSKDDETGKQAKRMLSWLKENRFLKECTSQLSTISDSWLDEIGSSSCVNLSFGKISNIKDMELLAKALMTNKTCTEIDLSDNSLGPEEIKVLAKALEINDTLTTINLNDNRIGPEGGKALAKALTINGTLTTIDLLGNNLGPEGGKALAKALEVNNTLTTINLLDNDLGPEGGKALAKALTINSTLTSITLTLNKIGPEGGIALAEALKVNDTLTKIKLFSNKIGSEGGKAFAEALKINSTLELIDLSRNNIGPEGGKALAEMLTVNSTLTSVHLRDESIGAIGVALIQTALKDNYTLLDLDDPSLPTILGQSVVRYVELGRNNLLHECLKPVFTGLANYQPQDIRKKIDDLNKFLVRYSHQDITGKINYLTNQQSHYATEGYRLLTGLSLTQIRGSEYMALYFLFPTFKHLQFQRIADLPVAKLLSAIVLPMFPEPSERQELCQLLLYRLRNYLQDSNEKMLVYEILYRLLHQGKKGVENEIEMLMASTILLNYKIFLNITKAALAILKEDSLEKQMLEIIVRQSNYHPNLLQYFMSSAAFIEEFKKRFPNKQSFALIEQCLGSALPQDTTKGYNPSFHSSSKAAADLNELVNIPKEPPPVITQEKVAECTKAIQTLWPYDIENKVKTLEKKFDEQSMTVRMRSNSIRITGGY